MAQTKQEQAEAEAKHNGELAAAAQEQVRVREREVLVQEIQRIRMATHLTAGGKRSRARLVQATQLGQDDGTLRPQAIASLRRARRPS